jgi:hypothetical protein|uniref:Transmembrane protein n=1 Tax=Eutreptiella gymnastica TaxID=73025 RepID=A0A7S4CVM8_9EUGL
MQAFLERVEGKLRPLARFLVGGPHKGCRSANGFLFFFPFGISVLFFFILVLFGSFDVPPLAQPRQLRQLLKNLKIPGRVRHSWWLLGLRERDSREEGEKERAKKQTEKD